jgi:hypothetical protein
MLRYGSGPATEKRVPSVVPSGLNIEPLWKLKYDVRNKTKKNMLIRMMLVCNHFRFFDIFGLFILG